MHGSESRQQLGDAQDARLRRGLKEILGAYLAHLSKVFGKLYLH